MAVVWADFSSGRPGAAALKEAGITGVIRYVGVGSASKRITAAEYADYAANGIQVLLVVELNTHDAEGGYNAGVANAHAALADARALGIPDSVGIAAASDEHLTTSQVAVGLDYVRGFRDVLGAARTGAYGFAEFIDAVHGAGTASWWWKCGSAPTTSESQWVTFWQRNIGETTQTVNKVVIDLNNAVAPLKGLLDMELTDLINDFITPPPADPIHVGDVLAEIHCALVLAANAPGGDTIPNRFSILDAAVAKLATPSVTLSADQLQTLDQAVSSAVATAVQGSKAPLSASDIAAIAQAVKATLGTALTA